LNVISTLLAALIAPSNFSSASSGISFNNQNTYLSNYSAVYGRTKSSNLYFFETYNKLKRIPRFGVISLILLFSSVMNFSRIEST
jgi:hypothetical protein